MKSCLASVVLGILVTQTGGEGDGMNSAELGRIIGGIAGAICGAVYLVKKMLKK